MRTPEQKAKHKKEREGLLHVNNDAAVNKWLDNETTEKELMLICTGTPLENVPVLQKYFRERGFFLGVRMAHKCASEIKKRKNYDKE